MFLRTLIGILILAGSCSATDSSHAPVPVRNMQDSIACKTCTNRYAWLGKEHYDSTSTVVSRFAAPQGYERVTNDSGSFGEWLRCLPLIRTGNEVHLYNGALKQNQSAQAAVIDIDVGNKDLQQCADAVMRLRAEYLFQAGRYADIAFNYTSGDRVDYKRWTEGRRILVEGNKTREAWNGKKYDAASHDAFRAYMNDIFNYAGTLSLSREMSSIPVDSIRPGDVFIHGGSPGHAEIVVDLVRNPVTGHKMFLLAQSYMPAQQIHILRNPAKAGNDPWYPVDFGQTLETPEYDFSRGELKRF